MAPERTRAEPRGPPEPASCTCSTPLRCAGAHGRAGSSSVRRRSLLSGRVAAACVLNVRSGCRTSAAGSCRRVRLPALRDLGSSRRRTSGSAGCILASPLEAQPAMVAAALASQDRNPPRPECSPPGEDYHEKWLSRPSTAPVRSPIQGSDASRADGLRAHGSLHRDNRARVVLLALAAIACAPSQARRADGAVALAHARRDRWRAASTGSPTIPTSASSSEPAELGLIEHRLSLFLPLWQNSTDEFFVRAARSSRTSTPARSSPTRSRPSPISCGTCGVAPAYRHPRDSFDPPAGRSPIGSASDKPFHSWDEMIVRANAFLRVPARRAELVVLHPELS